MTPTIARVRVVGYVRLSKRESETNGHGLDVQKTAIAEYCSRHDHELVAIFEDDGASGRTIKKRLGLSGAIEACESEGCSAIVATRVDRLARSSVDYHRIVEQVQKAGATIHFSEQPGFNLDSSHGRMLLSVLAAFAAFESDLVSDRTRAAIKVVKEKGSRSGKPIGNPNFVGVSPEIVARIQAMRTEGLSLRKIAERLNAEGVPTAQASAPHHAESAPRWHGESVRKILKRSESQPRLL